MCYLWNDFKIILTWERSSDWSIMACPRKRFLSNRLGLLVTALRRCACGVIGAHWFGKFRALKDSLLTLSLALCLLSFGDIPPLSSFLRRFIYSAFLEVDYELGLATPCRECRSSDKFSARLCTGRFARGTAEVGGVFIFKCWSVSFGEASWFLFWCFDIDRGDQFLM